MPMKQSTDLSPQSSVVVHDYRTEDGAVLEVSLRIQAMRCSENDEKSKSFEELLELFDITSGVDFLAKHKTNRADVSQIKVATGDVVWRVLNSDAAEAGWGPFLYDIAMELATIAGKGLCSHESHVSEDALRVWRYYFACRGDVNKTMLPSSVKPKRREEYLQYMYTKSPPVIIEELKRLNKWVARHTVIEPE